MPADDIRAKLTEWVDEEVRSGVVLHDAAAAVLARVHRERLDAEVLDCIGASAIADLWRWHQRDQRAPLLRPGARRVNVDRLNEEEAVLEAMYEVDAGRWMPLGDMGRAECTRIAARYTKSANGHWHGALFFAALGKKLSGKDDTVREKFSEAALVALGEKIRTRQIPPGGPIVA